MTIGGVSFNNYSYMNPTSAYTPSSAMTDPSDPTNPDRLAVNPDSENQKQNGKGKAGDNGNCETCKNRKYQDGSNDPGVSFKTPTKMDPKQASSAVRGHEMEHVNRERGKAQRENREVVSQSVTYRNAICPECGTSYVAGGTTRTTTRAKEAEKFDVGLEGQDNGKFFDEVA